MLTFTRLMFVPLMLPLRSIRKMNSPCGLMWSEVMDLRSGQRFSMTTGLCKMSLWSLLRRISTYQRNKRTRRLRADR